MGLVPARRRGGSSGVRLLVLLVTLAGLSSMHGLSDHGTASHGPAESYRTGTHQAMGAGSTNTVDDVTMRIHTAADVTGTSLDTAMKSGGAAPTSGVVESGDMYVAMALCLALLAGAIFLALRRRGLSYPLSSVVTTNTSRGVLPSRTRDSDPPDLYALSIQRC